jgi:hypothetical protein
MGEAGGIADAGVRQSPSRRGIPDPGSFMTEPGKGREHRRHARMKKRLQIRFGPGDLAHSGYTQDISEGGIHLQAEIIYPPGTVLALRIEYPDGTVATRGVVRWSRDLPPAFKRNLRGGMGVEFLEASRWGKGSEPAQAVEPAPPPRTGRGTPPEVSDQDLNRPPTRRRQVSTLSGRTFEVRETEHRGAVYVRIFHLPLTDGSHEAAFREAFWTREEADAAVKAFLKGH